MSLYKSASDLPDRLEKYGEIAHNYGEVTKTGFTTLSKRAHKKEDTAATGRSAVHRTVLAAVKSNSLESGVALSQLVNEGLPIEIANENKPIIDLMIAHSVLPRKTWEHARKSGSEALSPQNSERLVRALRAVEKAKEAFGDTNAISWLERPTKVFSGKAPIELLTNESGSRVVEMFLERSMHGFNA